MVNTKVALKRIKLSRRNLFFASAALLVVILAAYFAFVHSSSPIIPSTNPVSNASISNNSQVSNPSSSTTSNTSSQSSPPTSKSSSTSPTSSSGGPPITPFGNFVSNHHPGGSAPTAEESVCNTTAGASCYIQFTKGSEVKQLGAQITNSSGATYWDWDVASAGLSGGSWTVTAIATLNNQTKSATDALQLVVQ